MIGRFLLGAGLGGLVGTGLLALLSVSFSGPFPRPAGEAGPAAQEASAAGAPAPEAAPSGENPAVAGDAQVPEAPAPQTAAPEPVAEPAVSAPPEAPGGESAALSGSAPSQPEPPAGAETAPAAPAAPAAAPEIAVPAAPDAPDLPGDTARPEPPAVPGEAPPPAALAGAPRPEGPAGEDIPMPAEGPAPPPLTPEEEAMLADLFAGEGAPAEGEFVIVPADPAPADDPAAPAESGPGPDQGVVADPAPDSVAEDPAAEDPAADGPAPAEPEPGAGADPAPADPAASEPAPGEPARRITAGGEGSTLPATPSLGGKDTGVEIGRLPRIGDAADPAVPEAAGAPPRVAYARSFENPAGRPLFAVILMDDGAQDLDRAALAGLPFPVSFALDPQSPRAAEHAAIYRAAGQEVIMLATGLPEGAAASDVGVAFDAMARALPEAVAVMDLPARAFQADRPLASLVIPVIGDQGRGLVTWDAGLNAADQVARRADLPATVAFRDLDAEGEEAPVIRRYLDRAAFKAAQEGRVTVVGRTRPETIAALLEWSLEGRAGTVALAPVTAVLSAD